MAVQFPAHPGFTPSNHSGGSVSNRLKTLLNVTIFSLALALILQTGYAQDGNTAYAEAGKRLLRFPTTNGEAVVFSYAGDLYTVSTEGGIARKLTTSAGYEIFPRLAPDGSTIAFTGQYDGNTEVYRMPVTGGAPRRLTYTASIQRDELSDRMGPNNIVMGWLNTTGDIVFRSRMREWNAFKGELYRVSMDGGLPTQLPLSQAGFCSYSDDDSKLAYNLVFREFRTWKHYRGGMADDIWVFDFTTGESTNITSHEAQDIIPMWAGDNIYFISDRSGKFNLYEYNIPESKTRRLTKYTDFDIKFPSLSSDKKSIVYENGGYIHIFDIPSGKYRQIEVQINDDESASRPRLVSVKDNIFDAELAPDGMRAVFNARGDIFTVPRQYGNTRNITLTSGAHEHSPVWSPDGRWIACVSDQSGEFELWIHPQKGQLADTSPIQLTSGNETFMYRPVWSPDSRKILWSDRDFNLKYVDIQTREISTVDTNNHGEYDSYAWSPDSRWISFTRPLSYRFSELCLYDVESKQRHVLNDKWFPIWEPVFSRDGKYLLFLSERDFAPEFQEYEANFSYADMERIYIILLTEEISSPFAPRSDEVKESATADPYGSTGAANTDMGQEESSKPTVDIDLPGFMNRITVVPHGRGTFENLQCLDNRIYYLKTNANDTKELMLFDLQSREEKALGMVENFTLSADGKSMLIGQGHGQKWSIIDTPTEPLNITETLDLSGLELFLDPVAEWRQIFEESWRAFRDYFYAPNMHGMDWSASRRKFEAELDHVRTRRDLTYVIGEMISQLNAGHTYIGGGDLPDIKHISVGLLGADLQKDPESGYYQIKEILEGQNWDSQLRSPLTEPGVSIKTGEYILAIDGVSIENVTNPFSLLLNKAGKPVTLRVNSKPVTAGSRLETIVPITQENSLDYLNWVQGNIEKVSKATSGNVGYIHIPDMSSNGLNEFMKYFYPQLRKKALIVDVRGNGGGFVSPMIIERLRRDAVMIDHFRGRAEGAVDPHGTIQGPMICLADQFSASDGDIFTYRFKQYGMGKVVGKRTWGGTVGIRPRRALVDGGQLHVPEFGIYDLEGTGFIIEGRGVDPDIEVTNDPHQEYLGNDQQLIRAIEEILKELETGEFAVPPIPAYPEKNEF